MRKFTLFITFITQIIAQINLESFQANFLQNITNDQNRTLHYEGKIFYQKPSTIKWIYEKPIKKIILIQGKRAQIIEPELEQVTIRTISAPNLFAMLQNAKHIQKNRYSIKVGKREYFFTLEDGVPKKVWYKDELGNYVEITFKNVALNKPIDPTTFTIKVDPNWDIIYQ